MKRRISDLEEKYRNSEERRLVDDLIPEVYNRKGVISRLGRRLVEARRSNVPVSALLVDIDHFKMVNDKYGHVAGDAVLRHIAKLMSGSVRSTDIVGRMGGEEFCLILFGVEIENGGKYAERVRTTIKQNPLQYKDVTIKATVSVGYGQIRLSRERGGTESVLSFFDRIDTALYDAKSKGRNRIVRAE